MAITRWCGGRQWLRAVFLGAKEEGLDFEVVLIDSKVFRAVCYVQVKATAKADRCRAFADALRHDHEATDEFFGHGHAVLGCSC